MIEHQRPLLPQSSFVIRRSPMVGNMAQQSHSSCVGKYGSNPDFLLGAAPPLPPSADIETTGVMVISVGMLEQADSGAR
jgi:hypothetical protein